MSSYVSKHYTDIEKEVPPQAVPALATTSELYDDVREYDTLVSQDAYLRGQLQTVEGALAKVKSRLAQTVAGGETRYLQAGNSSIVRVSNLPSQGTKIGRIVVEQLT